MKLTKKNCDFPSNKQKAKSLKSLELERLDLTKTPDVSSFLSLEILKVNQWRGLVEIHPSIGYLHSLKYLELVNSYNQGEKVVHLPSSVCKCKTLSRFVIDRLNIKQLPENIGDLKHLKTMKITQCWDLENLPDSIGGLESLGDLCLRYNGITQLPESIGKLTNLITLDVSYNKLRGLPATICDLVHLQELDVSHNKDLRGDIPGEFDKLLSLKTLDFSYTGISSLPMGIFNLSRLETLNLVGCDEIQKLPNLPESLTILETTSWLPRAAPNHSSLTNLVDLTLSSDRGDGVDTQVWDGKTMSWIQNLQKLEYLTIHLPKACVVFSGLDMLSRLKKLNLNWGTPYVSTRFEFFTISGSSLTGMRLCWWDLAILEIKDFEFMEIVNVQSGFLKMLKHLEISGCPRLVEIRGLEQQLGFLQTLRLSKCDSIPCLPNPSNTKKRSSLQLLVENCQMLRNYEGPYEDYFREEEGGDFLVEEEEEDELSISRPNDLRTLKLQGR